MHPVNFSRRKFSQTSAIFDIFTNFGQFPKWSKIYFGKLGTTGDLNNFERLKLLIPKNSPFMKTLNECLKFWTVPKTSRSKFSRSPVQDDPNGLSDYVFSNFRALENWYIQEKSTNKGHQKWGIKSLTVSFWKSSSRKFFNLTVPSPYIVKMTKIRQPEKSLFQTETQRKEYSARSK